MGGRTSQVGVRFSSEERGKVQKAAKLAQRKEADWIRMVVLRSAERRLSGDRTLESENRFVELSEAEVIAIETLRELGEASSSAKDALEKIAQLAVLHREIADLIRAAGEVLVPAYAGRRVRGGR